MSDDSASIKPGKVVLSAAPVDAAQTPPAGAADAAATPGGLPPLVLPAAGGLVALLALYVVFVVLPGAVDSPAAPPVTEAVTDVQAAADPGRPDQDSAETVDSSPYATASDDAKRDFAREVLAAIVTAQAELEGLRVDLWGADDFATAQTIATDGDAAFARGQLDAARNHYEHALAQLKALRTRADEITADQLQAAEDAITHGNVAPARTALTLLASMYPSDKEVAALQQRFEVMPEVLGLVDDADLALRNGELEAARAGFQRALELDPARTEVQPRLADVAARLRERAFRNAMSRGFTAVGRSQFDTAERAFVEAGRLRPDSTELAEGRRQLASARTLARIERHRQAADQHLEAEDWQAAINEYTAALTVDDTLAFAGRGLRTAQRWQASESQMQRYLDDPGLLSDQTAYRDAVDVYSSATRLPGGGPRVTAKLDQLEQLLQVAAVPVPVTFVSDNNTEVVVYKVARLGQFARRQLELRPGRYTVVGSRAGFRDVRRDIMVAPNMPPVDIRCVESLAAAL